MLVRPCSKASMKSSSPKNSTNKVARKTVLFAPDTKDFDGRFSKEEESYIQSIEDKKNEILQLIQNKNYKECMKIISILLEDLKSKLLILSKQDFKRVYSSKLNNFLWKFDNLKSFVLYKEKKVMFYLAMEKADDLANEFKFDEALSCYHSILNEVCDSLNDEFVKNNYNYLAQPLVLIKAKCYILIGNLYFRFQNDEMARNYHEEGLRLCPNLSKYIIK